MEERRQDNARQAALDYHEFPRPGKLEVRATKPLANGRDLSRAYSPGVAEACLDIKADPAAAARYTARGNLVAVVSNGTAVLGLGNIGALASKPVMEGKAVLFKKFANIDCFDIELNQPDPEKLAEIVCALEPTFGAINLEDIKAPDCFIVEKLCRERMNIPVFHDDQHGTAIVVGAAATNALHIAHKRFEDIKVVSTGGGAAGIACLNMLLKLGVKRENVWLCDIAGLVHEGRTEEMTPQKAEYAQKSDLRTLDEAIEGADLFLGLSGPGVLKPHMVAKMAKRPIIFALANPTPEILPEDARAVAPDAIIATGRSDYPNQVNNVLCFPFIFRGALDVGATTINDEMQLACIEGIAALARATTSAEAAMAYRGEKMSFGADYLIPKPFDPRLIGVVSTAVARAAMETGVATRPLDDIAAYKRALDGSVFRSAMIMRPVFEAAATAKRRIVFAEGEDERVLRAANAMLEETTDAPILIGRPEVIERRAERAGLPIRPGRDFEIVNPENDPRYRDYWGTYHELMARRGVTPDIARAIMRTNTTAIGAVMVHRGEADSLICGTFGQYSWHLNYVSQVLARDGLRPQGALSLMILEDGPLFIADTQVTHSPTPEQVAEAAIGAARHVRRFGVTPKVALCSHSQFGNLDTDSGRKMRAAVEILHARGVDFIFDGEMHVDSALDPTIRERLLPHSRIEGAANVLVFSGTDSASGVRNALKLKANGLEVGPILMGMGNRAHIVTPSITTRGLLNMSAIAGTPVDHYR
ncbi:MULTISPECIES: NADP-dependent malic enzyme [Paracoccus]|jgi:malate dehydrogenase (oxaloacetate-decarboxylating)(NADP+)|uniref:Malate dehydrogenase (Oxaloacetate-decarboxylating) (NADP(+))., Phosphate acetyltransferase n=1 Tax=Paracoccus denitrificans (strain Pd 1222) TaxID=318586 RepID=A1B472_PARDP|nr:MULTISPECIES: NADP-dependent malic enzyme [Paracoccus]ABL70316.1 Malate dehydrogenase (oxaloacetate-decarboxylating) (NADP(+))., Phosphate acetyltransferase [Paracoccus denitrificans PD1222]MBB4627225.1 malate dehydrogenase (oxaloacetate-decarboxylating)(NADP+) [Paracoccus denitrificans]MCU7428002.1 NADP-dependent malic enzyme [Paracoccus denitrificans]MDK8874038.1 NADP-dependent malic enzyme [Paracoccus sp. SSJ]QAR25666.1 NADP-dependent malic enzyme [Paracoccus denitrificans]